jgi:hypothetical protein
MEVMCAKMIGPFKERGAGNAVKPVRILFSGVPNPAAGFISHIYEKYEK